MSGGKRSKNSILLANNTCYPTTQYHHKEVPPDQATATLHSPSCTKHPCSATSTLSVTEFIHSHIHTSTLNKLLPHQCLLAYCLSARLRANLANTVAQSQITPYSLPLRQRGSLQMKFPSQLRRTLLIKGEGIKSEAEHAGRPRSLPGNRKRVLPWRWTDALRVPQRSWRVLNCFQERFIGNYC